MDVRLFNQDCREALRLLPDNSIDSCVCDPPYEIGFMGKSWDKTGIAYCVELWREALRVLKPGGHLLAFGGTKTYHRMACAIEDAGFEIRDQMQWLYGSGFPKSLDVSKAIDKAAGAKREVIGSKRTHDVRKAALLERKGQISVDITNPATPAPQEWQGWGTALKPANEPICVARKPLSEKTVAKNVLKWGTGAINIDAGRIEAQGIENHTTVGKKQGNGGGLNPVFTRKNQQARADKGENPRYNSQGRWPANVLLDEDAAAELDRQTGNLKSGFMPETQERKTSAGRGGYGGNFGRTPTYGGTYGDKGGASRFFYVAKASKAERSAGCDGLALKRGGSETFDPKNRDGIKDERAPLQRNTHPTVKPVKLMRYLIALVTPEGGTVLDPFLGSGTTGAAAVQAGFKFIGVELSPEYFAIAKARIEGAEHGTDKR